MCAHFHFAARGMLDSGGGLNPFTSMIVERAISTKDFANHVADLRVQLAERRTSLVQAVQRHVSSAQLWTEPAGGYFLWIRLPGVDTAKLQVLASAKHAVSFSPGARFGFPGGASWHDHLRLCFAHYGPDELAAGAARLAAAVTELTARAK
jgi:2-aminoadipate transaminase